MNGKTNICVATVATINSRKAYLVVINLNFSSIKGEKKIVGDKKSQSYIHRELKHSSFCRSFSVGENIDITKLDAKFENGILEVVLPKKTPEKKIESVQKVEIK